MTIHQLHKETDKRGRPRRHPTILNPQKHALQINRHDIYILHTEDELVQCMPTAGECYFVLFTYRDYLYTRTKQGETQNTGWRYRMDKLAAPIGKERITRTTESKRQRPSQPKPHRGMGGDRVERERARDRPSLGNEKEKTLIT